MAKLTKAEKLALLQNLIELRIFCGYAIDDLIGIPLARFNFDAVEIAIQEMEKEKATIDGSE